MIPELEQLGFTRNEANVYQAVVRIGTCSVQQVAKETGLNRITVHSIVEKLEGMQLLLRTYEGKRRRVSAVSPAELEKVIRRDEESVKRKRDAFSALLPALTEHYQRSRRGLQVRTFTGRKGYEEICEEVLKAKGEILEYANIDLLNAAIGPYIAKEYLPRKHALQLRTKFLYVDSPAARGYIRKNYVDRAGAAPMEAKFIDPAEFSLDAFFVIFDDKLAILTPSTMDGVIIQDAATANSLRPFFRFVWERAGVSVSNT